MRAQRGGSEIVVAAPRGAEPSAPGPLMARDYRHGEEDAMHICPRAARPTVAVFTATALAIAGCGGGGAENATPTSSCSVDNHRQAGMEGTLTVK
jgi:hypothetical protein